MTIEMIDKWVTSFRFNQITPICVASISVSAISQTPWTTAWGLLRSWHNVLVLFQNPAWQAQTDTAVSLWVSWAKYQFCLRSSSWPFCSNSPEWRSRHMVTWFGRHGDAFGTTENAFFFFLSCIGPWTCPLTLLFMRDGEPSNARWSVVTTLIL